MRRRSGRGSRCCARSPSRRPADVLIDGDRRAAAPTSRASFPTTRASSPSPTTRPTPRPRASGSSKPWRRCCATSRRASRSSSCSTTCTGPTRARCDCSSSRSAALQQSPVFLVGTFRDAEARTPPLANTLATLGAHRRPRTARAPGPHASARSATTSPPSSATTPTRRSPTRCTTAPPATRSSSPSSSACCRTKASSAIKRPGAPVPEGVRDVLRTRLARLPEEAITVLTAGAIAGREFDVALVAHVCGIDEDRALDLVEAAWMTGIVDEAHDGLGHFRFSHELVREALVEGLTSLRRIRLHRRIGEAIEELHGERNPGFLTECAHHFAEAAPAGDALKAVLYGQRAADRLNAQLAYEDAIPTYERALELVETYDVGSWQTRTDLLIGLGWALRATGRLGDARLVLRRAMERARTEGDPVRIARAVLGIGGGGFWGWWDEFGVADLDLARLPRARARSARRRGLGAALRAPRPARGRGLLHDVARATARAERRSARDGAPARRSGRAHRRARVRAARELDAREPRAAPRARRRARRGRGRELDRVRRADRPPLPDGRPPRVRRPRRGRRRLRRVRTPRRAARPLRVPRPARVVPVDARVRRRPPRRRRAARRTTRSSATSLSNEPAAWTAYGAQMFRLRREQGRHAELEGVLRASAERQPHLALALLHRPRDDRRRARPHRRSARAARRVLADAPVRRRQRPDGHPARGADRRGGGRHRPRARPRTPSPASSTRTPARSGCSPRATCASVRSTGRAATSPGRSGRLDDAIECYERAIDTEEAVGARIYANRSRLGLAIALAARDADGDRERVEFLAPGGRAGRRGARHADGRRRGPGARLLARLEPAPARTARPTGVTRRTARRTTTTDPLRANGPGRRLHAVAASHRTCPNSARSAAATAIRVSGPRSTDPSTSAVRKGSPRPRPEDAQHHRKFT